VTVAILLALGTAKGVKDWVRSEQMSARFGPEVSKAVGSLPTGQRLPLLEAATRQGLQAAEVLRFIELRSKLPPQTVGVLDELPATEQLRFTGLSLEAAAPGQSTGPLGLPIEAANAGRIADIVQTAKLVKALGTTSMEGQALFERLAQLTTWGQGDRMVLGPWNEGPPGSSYVTEAVNGGGTYYYLPAEGYSILGPDLALRLNLQVLLGQLEAGIPRIDFVLEPYGEVLDLFPRTGRANEIRFLNTNAEAIGYELVGNTWFRTH
jgi:hypothetical protein